MSKPGGLRDPDAEAESAAHDADDESGVLDRAPAVEAQALPSLGPGAAGSVDGGAPPKIDPGALPEVEKGALPSVETRGLPEIETGSLPEVEPGAAPEVARAEAFASLPPVAQEQLAGGEVRRTSRRRGEAGRCAFCGSGDTFQVPPQGFGEWLLERFSGASLRRCHDCGQRQAIAGLGPLQPTEWSVARVALKGVAWVVLVAGACALIVALLRLAEEDSPAQRFMPPRPTRPSAPAPSPPSGPFVLRSTPPSAV